MVLATARTDIADFLSTIIYVYTLLLIAYIVIQLLFAAGIRPPYSRVTDSVIGFLRDICEPFLKIFRGIIPSIGGFDFSPIIAFISLQLFNSIVVQRLIHG
jgi:uncharacterized protein YggT (Ycf19 family)